MKLRADGLDGELRRVRGDLDADPGHLRNGPRKVQEHLDDNEPQSEKALSHSRYNQQCRMLLGKKPRSGRTSKRFISIA